MSDVVFLCNFPPTRAIADVVSLLATFGAISDADVVTEDEAAALLPPRRRRPTVPPLQKDDLGEVMASSGRVALVKFADARDAADAVDNMDGAVYYNYELVVGAARRK
jgi:hypothetical protein